MDFPNSLMEESEKDIAMQSSDDEYNSDNDDFYFESDHLPLRGNSDYRAVLRTIVILEAQRIEAAKHIDKLSEAQKRAIEDPEQFLKKLASKEGLELPGTINIQNVPKIRFEKYNLPNEANNSITIETKTKDENDFTVRGRVFDQSKPETFNQLWTCEEQRRLEELLIEYPPEPIEMRRFAKIAKALGNRTPRQVASRLQKYFQKLHAAGLPVPGRIPRNTRTYISSRKNRMVKHMVRPTTFFPSNYVPVNITDDDENNSHSLDPNYYRNGCNLNSINDEDMNNVIIVDEPSDTETDTNDNEQTKIAAIIRRVKRDKEKEHPMETSISEHNGYKCDHCNEDPIFGTRWHCITCKDKSADFCSDCFVTQTQDANHHSLDHIFIGYRVSTHFIGQSEEESEDDDIDDQTNDDANEDDSAGDISFDDSMSFSDNAQKSPTIQNNFLESNYSLDLK